jgi:indolepyruvate ferredoxin oxidoreductase
MARRLASACKAYDGCPAARIAAHRFGDTLYANMIMLGFAWQKGLVPVSSRALYRAITLNGVAADQNLQAFEAGRIAAHDPAARAPRPAAPTPETLPLDDLIARLTGRRLRPALGGARRRRPRRRGAAGRRGPDPRRRRQPLPADGLQGRI